MTNIVRSGQSIVYVVLSALDIFLNILLFVYDKLYFDFERQTHYDNVYTSSTYFLRKNLPLALEHFNIGSPRETKLQIYTNHF